MLGLHRIYPGHVGHALMVPAFDTDDDRMAANFALNANIDFALAAGKPVGKHRGLCHGSFASKVATDQIDQTLKVIGALGHRNFTLLQGCPIIYISDQAVNARLRRPAGWPSALINSSWR
jgi:hypothetical protein